MLGLIFSIYLQIPINIHITSRILTHMLEGGKFLLKVLSLPLVRMNTGIFLNSCGMGTPLLKRKAWSR